jgi:hypothetical protein
MNWLAVLGSPAKAEHERFLTEKARQEAGHSE